MDSGTLCVIVSRLRQVGLADEPIAVFVGMKYRSMQIALSRARGRGVAIAPVARGVVQRRAVMQRQLVEAVLNGGGLQTDEALFLIVDARMREAMRRHANALLDNGLAEASTVWWVLDQLAEEAPLATAA